MVKHSKKDDDYIGPSRGLAAWFHKFMMFLLFPLRKPLWFVGIAAVLFLAPTFRGVKPAEVHLWYWHHIKNLTATASQQLSDKARKVMPDMENVAKVVETIAPGTFNSRENAAPAMSTEPKLVAQPLRKVHRQVFEKAQNAAADSAMQTPEPVLAQRLQPVRPQQGVETSAKTAPKLNLRYLSVPEMISGLPQVINANELKVGGQAVFLYGIFVQPASSKGIDGEIYLRRLVEGKTVDCEINAYTYQNIATAICNVGGVNINRRMVDLGYSKNVALD